MHENGFEFGKYVEKKRKDNLLNEVLVNNGFLVIRVSYDQWSSKKGFNQACLAQLNNVLMQHQKNKNGLVLIGKAYESL